MPEMMLDEQVMPAIPDPGAGQLRFVREIGSVLLRMRQEGELLEYAISRLTSMFQVEKGAILLHDGKTLSIVAQNGEVDEPAVGLPRVLDLVDRLMRDGASDVQVLTEPIGGLRTLVLTPLAAHAAPMGVIVLVNPRARSLHPVELDTLRLVGQLLAARLREMRIQAKLDAAARRLASQAERFDPNSTADPQSGGVHKQVFIDAIHQGVSDAIQTGGHLSLLIINIDHYDAIKQDRGRLFADEVLARIALDIQGSIRARDMVARYGGEEFWVLLPATPGIGAVVVAERLRERIASMSFNSADGAWHLTASIGVGCLSPHVTSPEELIAKATQCLSQAQHLGGNQIILDWSEALEAMEEG